LARKFLIAFTCLAALSAIDAQREPADQFATAAFVVMIDAWQSASPTIAANAKCIYTPTCSVYGELAVRRYGGIRGFWMALQRIFRCSPWASTSGEDWP